MHEVWSVLTAVWSANVREKKAMILVCCFSVFRGVTEQVLKIVSNGYQNLGIAVAM